MSCTKSVANIIKKSIAAATAAAVLIISSIYAYKTGDKDILLMALAASIGWLFGRYSKNE